MILSGKEIQKCVTSDDIQIHPFNEKRINPNSYNLRLHNQLLVYKGIILDMKKLNECELIEIPPEGLVLEPGKLYLGRTVEHTYTNKYVPMIEGRSSVGRLGLYVHVTAGFGDIGFNGFWTLELSCVQPIRVYPDVEVCQIFYHTIQGEFDTYKNGKYQDNEGVQPSLLFKDFEGK